MTPALAKRISAGVIQGSFPIWSKPLTWWLATSTNVVLRTIGEFALAFDLFLFLVFLAAVLTILASPVLLLVRKTRFVSLGYVAVALIFVPSFVYGVYLGRMAWRGGIGRFIDRSRPLIEAIESYQWAYGMPPESLQALVPEFLPSVPRPAFGPTNRYLYLSGREARDFAGEPWTIRVPAPSHPMGFDQVLYFPGHDYPEVGYGGGIERIGDWGYVHE